MENNKVELDLAIIAEWVVDKMEAVSGEIGASEIFEETINSEREEAVFEELERLKMVPVDMLEEVIAGVMVMQMFESKGFKFR